MAEAAASCEEGEAGVAAVRGSPLSRDAPPLFHTPPQRCRPAGEDGEAEARWYVSSKEEKVKAAEAANVEGGKLGFLQPCLVGRWPEKKGVKEPEN